MGYKLEVKHPDFPKGAEFDIGGMLVKNGEITTMTAEDEQRVSAFHGSSVKDAIGGSPFIKISGSKEGGDD